MGFNSGFKGLMKKVCILLVLITWPVYIGGLGYMPSISRHG